MLISYFSDFLSCIICELDGRYFIHDKVVQLKQEFVYTITFGCWAAYTFAFGCWAAYNFAFGCSAAYTFAFGCWAAYTFEE